MSATSSLPCGSASITAHKVFFFWWLAFVSIYGLIGSGTNKEKKKRSGGLQA
jgi:hypothetical protein